ncbi:hypothetical protein PFISCL1PPCAC_27270 [Pristionchus fissidentatus]|uniref:Uncharacterized protein n=1 Tax=Pristionchus fissidentatus TaxID=1538716 RepID=A0AAV5WXC7_9BILA|nr:hypothetical protein PFISCL1PPCAC_27270 [Pristionchus fissidentatus]
MDALTKISSRVTDLTKKSKAKRLEDDTFLPQSFIPPTFDDHTNYAAVPTQSTTSQPPKESKNIIPNSIRRFSPFPRKQNSNENKETPVVRTTETKTKEAKDSKYRKIGEDGEAEKTNGVWRLKDSAMDRVDKMKKNRQGEYGVQLLDDDQD